MAGVPPPRTVAKLRRTSSTPVADHGVFSVERRSYEGLPRDVSVFRCPDWCNVIAETEDGRLVMVWQYRYGTDELSLEIPGGVVDPGEAPADAALRELREETGYAAEAAELLSVVDPNPALQGNKCWSYVARGARLATTTSFDDLEQCELALVPKEDVAAAIDDGTITHALVIVALEAWLRRARAGG